MWCLDEHQLAAKRGPKVPVFTQLIRDPATRQTSASELAQPAMGAPAIAWGEELVATAALGPLVLSTDNGEAFTSEDFESCLDGQEIAHLRNLLHTPQHNTHAERSVKEVKQALEIPKDRLPPAPEGFFGTRWGGPAATRTRLLSGASWAARNPLRLPPGFPSQSPSSTPRNPSRKRASPSTMLC